MIAIIGATGAVGQGLLAELSELQKPVTAFARRPGPEEAGVTWRVQNLEDLQATDFAGFTHVLCALGTTRKDAGKEGFVHVDRDLVLHVARAARDARVSQFQFVSSMGADSKSRLLYSRIKGEVEAALTQLEFPSLVLVRPSLLDMARKPPRRGEKLARSVMRIARPILPENARSITPQTVAQAMIHLMGETGTRIVSSGELHLLGTRVA